MYLLLAGFYGLIYGSFINAYVWRTHSGEKIGRDRSRCPTCKETLKVKDLLPVVSWLSLRGKCRYCNNKISIQYPIVELITSISFVLSFLLLPMPASTLEWLQMLLLLGVVGQFIALAVYDLKWHLLPNSMIIVLLGLVGAYHLLSGISGAPLSEWLISPLLGALGAFGFFYLLHIGGKGQWMGAGDVKLVFALGLLLGGWHTLVGMVLAFNIAAILSLGLIALKIKSRKDVVPFGPFLIFGAWLAFLFAEDIIDWYLRISGVS